MDLVNILMDPVHGPETVEGVHGPGVHVLYSPTLSVLIYTPGWREAL